MFHESDLKVEEKMVSVDVQGFVKEGITSFENEDYETAMEYFEKAISIDQECVEAWYGKGNVLSRIKEDEEALEAYKKAIKTRRTFAKAWYEMGNVLSNMKRYEEALKAYEKVAHIKPGNSEYVSACYKRGDILSNLGRYKEADRVYEEAIKILEGYEEHKKTEEIKLKLAEIYSKRGNVLGHLKENDNALEAYRRAKELCVSKCGEYEGLVNKYTKLKKFENTFEYQCEIGDILSDLKRYEDASRAYEKAIEIFEGLEPDKKTDEENLMYIKAWYRKGNALSKLNEHGEALEAYESAIETYGKFKIDHKVDKIRQFHLMACYNKAVTLYHLKKYEEALTAYKEAIKICEGFEDDKENTSIEPIHLKALNSRGTILYYQGKYKEALEVVEETIRKCRILNSRKDQLDIKRDHSFALYTKGIILHNCKDYEKEYETYEKALEIDSKYIFPHAGLGKLLLAYGDIENASRKIEKALEIDSGNNFALSVKGEIEIEKENYDQAIDFFRKITSLSGGNPLPLLWTAYAEYLKAEFPSTVTKASKGPTNSKENKSLTETKMYNKRIFAAIRELEKARDLSGKNSNRELRECILYFLGYFYYKTNDVFTAKERLEECIKLESRRVKVWEALNSGSVKNELCRFFCYTSGKEKMEKIKRFVTAKSTTEQRARELLNHIWKYKLKPAWWRWWWSSPVHKWSKRFIFVLLLFPVLSFLFYVLVPESIHISRENLFVYILLVPASIPSIKENLDVYIAMISISVFFLLLPTIEKIKVKEIEVEMSSPPSLEPFVSPSMIGEQLGELEA